jgi:hypothetical protein
MKLISKLRISKIRSKMKFTEVQKVVLDLKITKI